MDFIATIELILGVLTVIGQLMLAGGLCLFFFEKDDVWLKIVRERSLVFSLVVALVAVSGSLFFSEIADLTPCKLCWFQRVLMYPQLILLAVASLKRDHQILDYTFVLSLLGAGVAAYHYLLQIGAAPSVACSTVGYSVDCSQNFTLQFGYITIPLMALTAFLLLIFFANNSKIKQ